MEINKEQASEIIKLIEQALLDGFDDEILVSHTKVLPNLSANKHQ